MSSVTFEKATHVYPGADEPAVDALDLAVEDGEFMVLVGPSGCGKSTSLRMLAGLEEITTGAILIGDRDVTDVPPKQRDIAMVFQNYALYPHMSVAENMGFALKIAGVSKDQITQKVRSAAELLGLEDFLSRKPKALSGGQRQRVAMGRAIVREPQVFLMDEPLSNLDAKLRVQTRSQIAALQRRLGTTTVYVTHDQTEALTMGDRVAVLKDGILQQVGTPRAMYDAPANAFVAGFIGSPQMNLFQASISGQSAHVAGQPVTLARTQLDAATAEGSNVLTLGARPEDLRLDSGPESGAIPAEVVMVEELGADAYVFAHLGSPHAAPAVDTSSSVDGDDLDIVIRVDGRTPPAKGDTVHVLIDPEHTHVFSVTTGARL